MDQLSLMTLLPTATALVFIFVYGACVGSLTNVLVYRLPRGLSVVRPASRCPSCQTKLTWRENIPVLGWILLRGRCRFCKNRISPEYPLVEGFVGLLFCVVYLLFYALPSGNLFGLTFSVLQPEWAENGLLWTWPMFVTILVLLGCLVAITLIDARTAQIPLVLVWVPAATALVLHVGHAVWIQVKHGNPVSRLSSGMGWRLEDGVRWVTSPGEVWSIASSGVHGWGFVGAAAGGTIGLGLALVLLKIGLIRRSFADYEEWETKALADAQAKEGVESDTESVTESGGEDQPSAQDADLWIQYPYARREMLKEVAFVAPPVALGVLGMSLMPRLIEQMHGPWKQANVFSPMMVPPIDVPLWLAVASGVAMGYLIGGGVVWAVRILGSLAFGKEALGLGDVHLVAAIGACLGWIDGVLGFFGAAFVGLAWTIAGWAMGGRVARTLPYGPYIAIASVMVLLGKPGVEWFLSKLAGMTINLP